MSDTSAHCRERTTARRSPRRNARARVPRGRLALALGLGAVPIGISEKASVGAVDACFTASGLIPAPLDELRKGRNRYAVLDFPIDPAHASQRAEEILSSLQPKALITIDTCKTPTSDVKHWRVMPPEWVCSAGRFEWSR